MMHWVAAVLLWPAAVAHEATHYAAGRPWARPSAVSLHPLHAHIIMGFADGTPRPVVAVAALAPTIVGCIAATLLVGYRADAAAAWAAQNPGLALFVVAGWAAYTAPSIPDLRACTQGSTEAKQ